MLEPSAAGIRHAGPGDTTSMQDVVQLLLDGGRNNILHVPKKAFRLPRTRTEEQQVPAFGIDIECGIP
eukprot:10179989-Lingulodinium_polyedra.AAC.1